ncbi:hypothetical protein O3P69_018327 [Scylla paramamosain]|uniref:Uncharacterized protein n=1 Tax=Scylla paramamosain TaxID=85552 RepID=A0AAW0TMA2_SCYPA
MGPRSLWHKIQLGHERDLVRTHEVLIQWDALHHSHSITGKTTPDPVARRRILGPPRQSLVHCCTIPQVTLAPEQDNTSTQTCAHTISNANINIM